MEASLTTGNIFTKVVLLLGLMTNYVFTFGHTGAKKTDPGLSR